MNRKHIGFVAVVGLSVTLSALAQFQQRRGLDTLPRELKRATRLEDEDVTKFLTTLGPAVADQLAAGRTVTVQGLGTFRVVRIPESRNLDHGKVVVEAARNVVEFLPDANLTRAANAPGAVPAVVVPAFQYVPLPGQTPSTRVPERRSPSTRTP